MRPARQDDISQISEMIRGLAAFERAPDEAQATPDMLRTALFSDPLATWCHVAERGSRRDGFAL